MVSLSQIYIDGDLALLLILLLFATHGFGDAPGLRASHGIGLVQIDAEALASALTSAARSIREFS